MYQDNHVGKKISQSQSERIREEVNDRDRRSGGKHKHDDLEDRGEGTVILQGRKYLYLTKIVF